MRPQFPYTAVGDMTTLRDAAEYLLLAGVEPQHATAFRSHATGIRCAMRACRACHHDHVTLAAWLPREHREKKNQDRDRLGHIRC